MGIIAKQSFWGSIWSYIGIALGYINLVILFPKFFTPDEFGLTRIFIAASMITAQLGTLGIINISVKYFPYFKTNDQRHNGFLFFAFSVATFGSILIVLALILFKPLVIDIYSERSQLFVDYYYWLLPITVALVYFRQYSAYARVILKASVQNFAREVLMRFMHFALIVLFALNLINFEIFVQLFVLSYFVNGMFLVLYLAIKKAVHFMPDFNFYKTLPFKAISKYGLFMIFSSIGTYIAGSLDVLMLGALSTNGLADVAIYSVGFHIGNIVQVPVKAVFSIALPIVADALKKNDLKKVESIYKKSSITQLTIGCLLILGLWANIDNVLQILPETYMDGKWVIFLIAISQIFNLITGINSGIIVNSHYYKYDSYFLFFLILSNVILNFVFIKMYGLIGAALATAITTSLFNIGRTLLVKLKSGMQPLTIESVYILLISLGIYLLQLFLPDFENLFLDLIIRSVVITIAFVFLIYQFNISEDINRIIDKGFNYLKRS